MIDRRSLLLSPLAAAILPRKTYAAQLASLHGEIYRQLGIRPLINAAGTYTTLTGSLLVPQAREAMIEASKYFVPLVDLQQAVGARIAKLVGVPAAMVTLRRRRQYSAGDRCLCHGQRPREDSPHPRYERHEGRSHHGARAPDGLRPCVPHCRSADRRSRNCRRIETRYYSEDGDAVSGLISASPRERSPPRIFWLPARAPVFPCLTMQRRSCRRRTI